MHFYAITYEGLLRLPMCTFWALARNIERIRAECDIRAMQVIQNAVSPGKNTKSYIESLKSSIGNIVEIEYANMGFDKAGFNHLKALIVGG